MAFILFWDTVSITRPLPSEGPIRSVSGFKTNYTAYINNIIIIIIIIINNYITKGPILDPKVSLIRAYNFVTIGINELDFYFQSYDGKW